MTDTSGLQGLLIQVALPKASYWEHCEGYGMPRRGLIGKLAGVLYLLCQVMTGAYRVLY